MAKKRYPWKEIKADFEKGLSQPQLRKKYNMPASTLSSRIARDGWVLTHEQTACLTEFSQASANLSENYAKANATQQKELTLRVETILEDNELIQNNRRLLKVFQTKILDSLKEGVYESASEIRQGVASIKDIEAVANPTKAPEINIQNTQQSITKIQRTIIKADDDARD